MPNFMGAQEKIVDALSRSPLCDDCLSRECMIRPRQQVNQKCAYLLQVGQLIREKELCPQCGRMKLVNRIKDEALEKTIRRRPVAVQVEPERFKAAPEESTENGTVVVRRRLLMENPWCWEGNVQERIVEHLMRDGFRLTRVANTHTREPGRDIEAESTNGKKLWLTVKGYPEKSAHTQARHWFAECLFDLILYREADGEADLGVGLPDGYATYGNLAKRIKWFKNAVGFRFYWVKEDGTVRIE